MKRCALCGKRFNPKNKQRKICSGHPSYEKHRNRIKSLYKIKPPRHLRCVVCGKKFQYKGSANPVTCSKKCSLLRRKENIIRWAISNIPKIRKSQAKHRKTEKFKSRNRRYAFYKRHTDLQYNIAWKLRMRIRGAIKRQFTKKAVKTIDVLGCTYERFVGYLEAKFTKGMTWSKFLNGKIHIDHVIPCSAFDLTKESQQKKCFHYTNLQPLWAIDNIKKSNKVRVK